VFREGRTDAHRQHLTEFIHFHERIQLDERDDCYARMSGSTDMIIVISAGGVIVGVATEDDNAGAACCRRSYDGLEVEPPFSPYAIRVTLSPASITWIPDACSGRASPALSSDSAAHRNGRCEKHREVASAACAA
jgi:hypothetical protein